MIMTSSQQQPSFLNTGGNPPQNMNTMNTSTPNSINPSPTISTFRPPQLQAQNTNINAMNSTNNTKNPSQQTLMLQQFQQQQHIQFLQQQYFRNTVNAPMMNTTFNLMNSMGNMISPGTPSLPMTMTSMPSMPSPNIIPNVSSTTPRQQYPSHNIHSLYPHPQHHHYIHTEASSTPQQRPQTPITTIGGASSSSVASITSFTPSMASLGPNTMMGMTAASGNFGGSNTHNQHQNDLPQQQQTRFNPIGGGAPNNNENNRNNQHPNDPNEDDDGKQSNDNIDDNHPSAVLGQPPNSIIVNVSSNNKYGLRNYLVRARRILRLAKRCRICGIGSAVSVACEVTEVLKRECVAAVFSIETGLIEDEQSTRPTIEIIVKRGKFAHLVSDFRRRKVIEVFEKKDLRIDGVLSFDFVRKMDLSSKFKADTYRAHQAQHYLQRLAGDPDTEAVDLPKFIHYCSIIIHPLLLEYHFKMAIAELGGYVDVHDGHLPREHTEKKVAQLQKLGRIEPFLKEGDDIEFDPQNFKHWFNDRFHQSHSTEMESQQSSQYYNNRGIRNSMISRRRGPPNYPTPMIHSNVDNSVVTNIPNTVVSPMRVFDDTMTTTTNVITQYQDDDTTNAVDGSVITNTVTEQPMQGVVKPDDPIPEDESVMQDVDEIKELTQKIDNMTEEDDGSQVYPSDTSKITTVLSVDD